MKVLSARSESSLQRLLRDLNVDPYGIKIMCPKAANFLIKLNGVSSIMANILKQEMLSLGGDVAVSRDVLTATKKKTDCLLIGNLAQFGRLIGKLRVQPLGARQLADEIAQGFLHYRKQKFEVSACGKRLKLGTRTHIMGIVNVTPDSFSGDGLFRNGRPAIKDILNRIECLCKEGADSIDIGGESSRPGARPVPLHEELDRTIPVIKEAAERFRIPISIDTCKPEVARRALDHGASIVNDITSLRNDTMAKVVSRYKAGIILMHMKGNPLTMQSNPKYGCLMDDIIAGLAHAVVKARQSGVDEKSIIVDPGIGFGKTLAHNLEILEKLSELRVLGMPVLVGPSRKSFIGKILDVEPSQRLAGTLAACVVAARNGAQMLRVHDVKPVREALMVAERIDSIC